MLFFSKPKKPRTIQIQLRHVSKSFGDKKVLDGMSLDVHAGESLVIIGGSGTGKSVTLKCILGLLAPDSGDILIGGDSVVRMRAGRRDKVNARIGMLFQGAALFDSLSVWENVAFVALQQKMPRPKARAMAVATLARVGLPPDAADVYPADLSGGMKKRVGLARAIANKPDIIFFDEPTTGLDPIMSDVINDLIKTTVKSLGVTALTITHDMASARKIADRIAMLYQGKIIWVGNVRELNRTKNPYVRQFVAGSARGPITTEIK